MLLSATLLALWGAGAVVATECSMEKKCPKDTPCCSQYGMCGTGAYCLGGCDPRMSYSLDACAPAPVCNSSTTRFDTLDGVVDVGSYLGDSTKARWVVDGTPALYRGNLLLTMPKRSVGTIISSTSFMWYGTVKARLKTSRGKGVVTAFILYSGVKDEVDFEFVGADLDVAQSNYYSQGRLDYHNAVNISVDDTFNKFHDYEIRWTPDQIQWYVDGKLGRTKLRKDTWDEEKQQWKYPQTPARVQLSLWPAGQASNEKGTIDWAGGKIDWDTAPDMVDDGYYFATVSQVSIECYNAKHAPGTNSGKSYTYGDAAGTNDSVVDGDKDTVLGSLHATGLDMDKGKEEGKSLSWSSTESAAKPRKTQDTIPGSSPASPGREGGAGPTATGGGGTGPGQGGGSSDCDVGDFSQNCGGSDGDKASGKSDGNKAGASALAVVIACGALLWM